MVSAATERIKEAMNKGKILSASHFFRKTMKSASMVVTAAALRKNAL